MGRTKQFLLKDCVILNLLKMCVDTWGRSVTYLTTCILYYGLKESLGIGHRKDLYFERGNLVLITREN